VSIALPYVNQDPRFWLRLIITKRFCRKKPAGGGTTFWVSSSDFKDPDDPTTWGGKSWCREYRPGMDAVDHKHDYLDAHFPCYLGGQLLEERVMDIPEFPSIPFTPLFNIGAWAVYWRKNRKEEDE